MYIKPDFRLAAGRFCNPCRIFDPPPGSVWVIMEGGFFLRSGKRMVDEITQGAEVVHYLEKPAVLPNQPLFL